MNVGLVDLDIQPLDKKCIKRAFYGSPRDAAIVHRSVAGVLYAICECEINRIAINHDINKGRWRTDPWDAARSYAADITHDWLMYGASTDTSLMDTTMMHIIYLKEMATSIPEWHFSLSDTVVRGGRRIPRILDKDTTTILPLW